jgi:hypothetical protein
LVSRRTRGATARSLKLAQWKVGSFVKALDFAAVEALVTYLQPRAEGFRCLQVLDSIADSLRRCREAPVVLAATLGALRQEQFSGGAVVEGGMPS